jgi:hypothetical protein
MLRNPDTKLHPLKARLIPRLARALFVSVLMHIGCAGKIAGFLGRAAMTTGSVLMHFDAAGRPIERRSTIEKMFAGRVGDRRRGWENVISVTKHQISA